MLSVAFSASVTHPILMTSIIKKPKFAQYPLERNIKPSPAALNMFEFMNIHGYANSKYLRDWAEVRQDYTTETMKRSRKGGYVELPQFQKRTINPLAHFLIYRLTVEGRRALAIRDRFENTFHPAHSGPHDYGTACVTGSIHLAARAAGVAYIPAHKILDRADTNLAYEWEELKTVKGRRAMVSSKLIPDQLFALKGPTKRTLFAVEFDRGTEPGDSKTKRKSYRSMISSYHRYVVDGKYKVHLRTPKTGMLVLVVFSSRVDEILFHKKLAERYVKCGHILTRTIEGIDPDLIPMEPDYDLFNGPWSRLNMADYYISEGL